MEGWWLGLSDHTVVNKGLNRDNLSIATKPPFGKRKFHGDVKASDSLCYPNPTRERGAIPQVPHSRFGLGLVVFILPLA